ncbi:MAG: hypothetical protein AAB726_01265 [Patescibacteria group bacterium]
MTTATKERFAIANLTGGELNALVKKVGGEERVREVLRDEVIVATTTLATKNDAKSGSLDKLEEALKRPLALLAERQTGHVSWHGMLYERLLELKGLLDRAFPKMPSTMKVWKTLKLGTGIKDAAGFRTAIKAAGMKVGDWANDILGKPAFTASETEQEVNLVNLSVAELGFKDGARYDQICAKAQELGLELCPNEVGPQLRLQYTDQPKGEWLIIATESIADSHGDLSVFGIEHDDGELWLGAHDGDPGDVWDADDRFVFVRRK